jgi:hypothetical protein
LWPDFLFHLDRFLLFLDELEEDEDELDEEDEDEGEDEEDDKEDDDEDEEEDDDEDEDEDDNEDEDEDDNDDEDDKDDNDEFDLPLSRGPGTLLADAIVTFFFNCLSPLSLDPSLPMLLSIILLKWTPEGTFRPSCLVEMLLIASAARLLPLWVPARLIDDMNLS